MVGMKIGILQTGHAPSDLAERHGQYTDMFQRLLAGHGFSFGTWNVVDGLFPGSTGDSDGWLVTGSKHSVYERTPWIRTLEQFLRDCYADCVPVVGVCFGHQVLASALGGKVEKFDGGWGVGRQTYEFGGKEICLNAWHQDQVTEIPEAAEVTGSSVFCRHAMLSYGDRAMSIQAHPEFDHSFIEGLIERRGVGVVPAEQLDRARSDLGLDVQSDEFARVIAGFFLNSRRERPLQVA